MRFVEIVAHLEAADHGKDHQPLSGVRVAQILSPELEFQRNFERESRR